MNTDNSRNCPVCASAAKDVMTRITLELFDGHPMDRAFNVVQCTACGHVYQDISVTQDALNRYYAELSRYEDKNISYGYGLNDNERNRMVDTAAFISKHIDNKDSAIVDLGCSGGGLLKELAREGFKNLSGVDPSAVCADIVRNELGFACYNHSIFDIPADAGKFEVVTITHVLEHILDVRGTIRVIDGLLVPGGYAYVETPNALDYRNVIHAPLQEFNTEHINHFSGLALENLMNSMGFRTVVTGTRTHKMASNQDYPSVFGIFRKEEGFTKPMIFDGEIREKVQEYIDRSDAILEKVKASLAALPADRPVGLFGMGQFAFKLLATPEMRQRTSLKLFDNSMPVGRVIRGVTILPGSSIVEAYEKEPFSLVISSMIHEKDIRQGIESQFLARQIPPPLMIGFSHFLDN